MELLLKSKAKLPRFRSINTMAVLVDYLSKNGFSQDTVLSGSGFSSEDLRNPSFRISTEHELSILKNILRFSTEPDIGLKIGKFYHIGVLGPAGLAAMFCDTAMDALKLFVRYMDQTLTYCQYVLYRKNDTAFVEINEIIDLKDLRTFICERSFVTVQRLASDLIEAPLHIKELQIESVWKSGTREPVIRILKHWQNDFTCPPEPSKDVWLQKRQPIRP
jgi:hypothetical protein